ncbi:NAD-binding protein [Mycena floridula]|nr:NAD-binding protein [Mycena floridula]
MSSNKIDVFMTGVTGYIGGAVLQRFLSSPYFSSMNVTALLRSSEKADKLQKYGVNAIVGSLKDLALVENLASLADVVFAMADCDDVPGAEATLRGLKKRFETTGKKSIFIHTSGAGTYAEKEGTGIVFDDTNADQLEKIPLTKPHRPVEVIIIQGDKDGYVNCYIISPTIVYGVAQGLLYDEGIANSHSVQIPTLIKAALSRGQGGMVDAGQGLWPYVEIHEVAEIYLVLFDKLQTDLDSVDHGRNGYYFGMSVECNFYKVGQAIAEAMVDLGRAKSVEPTSFTPAEIDEYLSNIGPYYYSNECRCVCNHSLSLGWKPKHTMSDLVKKLKEEVAVFVNQGL